MPAECAAGGAGAAAQNDKRHTNRACDAGPATDVAVTVVVVHHNRPGLLRQALDSLADQTLPSCQFTVVVVDDGSSSKESTQFLDEVRAPMRARSRVLNMEILMKAVGADDAASDALCNAPSCDARSADDYQLSLRRGPALFIETLPKRGDDRDKVQSRCWFSAAAHCESRFYRFDCSMFPQRSAEQDSTKMVL